jgi:hypothetical protein
MGGIGIHAMPPGAKRMIRRFVTPRIFAAAVAAILAAMPLAAASAQGDACRLLTRSEIAGVQKGSVVETKPTSRESGGFAILACFYRVEPFDRSVSLELTRRARGSAHDPRERWERMFSNSEESDDEDGAGNSEKSVKSAKEKGEKESPPRPVSHVGEAAYWISNPVSGALYVLKGNSYLRVSLGGPDPETVKIEKASELARKALARF